MSAADANANWVFPITSKTRTTLQQIFFEECGISEIDAYELVQRILQSLSEDDLISGVTHSLQEKVFSELKKYQNINTTDQVQVHVSLNIT